ncbi:hypothetical protein [Nocardia nova]
MRSFATAAISTPTADNNITVYGEQGDWTGAGFSCTSDSCTLDP